MTPSPTEAKAFLDTPVIWRDLARNLTGHERHDLMMIGAFCFAYHVPMTMVLAKVLTHISPGSDAIH
jgi:hypothetical protein